MSSIKKGSDKTINKDDANLTLNNYNKSNLKYDNNHSFNKCCDNKKFDNQSSFKSKYVFLVDFFKDLNIFSKVKTQKEKTKACETALKLYNELLVIYFDRYNDFSYDKESKMDH